MPAKRRSGGRQSRSLHWSALAAHKTGAARLGTGDRPSSHTTWLRPAARAVGQARATGGRCCLTLLTAQGLYPVDGAPSDLTRRPSNGGRSPRPGHRHSGKCEPAGAPGSDADVWCSVAESAPLGLPPCRQRFHERPRVAMTNSIRNSDRDSTRPPGRAMDRYRDHTRPVDESSQQALSRDA